MSGPVVFVTRKFPPSVGGMETLATGVWRSVRQARPDAVLIAHGGANAALVSWLPLAVLRVLAAVLRRRPEMVLTGDALTYAVLRPLLALCRVPNATMVMGLDITYDNRLYRAFVLPRLRSAPRVLAISVATAQQAVAAGVAQERIRVVRIGVELPAEAHPTARRAARAAVRARLGLPDDAVLLVTVGRLVRRKGARWFTAEVLPQLPQHVHYLLAGAGPELEALQKASVAAPGRVHLLGRVSDEERGQLLLAADVFVQPNIAVPGDMEGFGLVTVEAAMRDLPVIAADLEGIRDAVVAGQTGVLLPSGDAQAWLAGVLVTLQDDPAGAGRRCGAAARALYGEDAMAAALCDALGLAVPATSKSR